MKINSGRGIWAALLTAGMIAAAAIGMTGAASAEQQRASNDDAKVKMKIQGNKPVFVAPASVGKGEKLKVINRTSVKEIGPHTFSLIKPGLLPQGQDVNRCESNEYRPCRRVFQAHQVDPKTFEVNRPVVDKGKDGWDRMFTKKRNGDSFYTETQGEKHTRKVKADAGKTLGFFCLIHPKSMQGTIEVK